MYAITRQANLLSRLGDLECLILLVSCICHDLDHPGYNNIYQINARTELALRWVNPFRICKYTYYIYILYAISFADIMTSHRWRITIVR